MPGRQIARVTSAVDDGLPLSGFQRLNNDLCGIPEIAVGTLGKRKENSIAGGQYLRPVRHLVSLKRDKLFRLTAIRRYQKNSIGPAGEHDAPFTPAHPGRTAG